MDLSNARIIEWEHSGETHTAVRKARGERFQYVFDDDIFVVSEEEAREHGSHWKLRVVAEFPASSLAERVGDAPAFRVNREGGWPDFYYRHGDKWVRCGAEGVLYSWEQLNSMVGLDLSTVVPLYPREVVS